MPVLRRARPGPNRRSLLEADLASTDDRAAAQRQTERARHQRVVADLTRRQQSLIRQAQDGDPDDPFTQALRGNYNDLEKERKAALAAIGALDRDDAADQSQPGPGDIDLLDALPIPRTSLAPAPATGPVRGHQLKVEIASDDTDIVTLAGSDVDAVGRAAGRIPDDHGPDRTETAGQTVSEPGGTYRF